MPGLVAVMVATAHGCNVVTRAFITVLCIVGALMTGHVGWLVAAVAFVLLIGLLNA